MGNRALDGMVRFSERHGQTLTVGGRPWRYYRIGEGAPLLWLGGGLRRAALGYAFMERLAARHMIIAPDYPPVMRYAELDAGFTAILRAEGVEKLSLAGQSYGGVLAQIYLALHPRSVDRIVLSSTGPASFGPGWVPVEYAIIALVKVLPERFVKGILARGLGRVLSTTPEDRDDWRGVLRHILRDELTRADVVSHFAVIADAIRRRLVSPRAFVPWTGCVAVISAEDAPTQGRGDRARYEKLLGRRVEFVRLGGAGHTALLSDPAAFAKVLESVLD